MRERWIMAAALGAVALTGAEAAGQDPFKRLRDAVGKPPAPAGTPAPERPTRRPLPAASASASKPAASTGGMFPDQGVHNPVHAAHQSQIVFTRRDLGIGAITEGDIASDFTLGEPMFFRVFTERSAANALALANNVPAQETYPDGVHYVARFTVGGQSFDTGIFPWGGRKDHETWTTWRGQFVNPGNAQVTPGTDAFLELLSRATAAGLLAPGKHAVTMEVIPFSNTERHGKITAGPVAKGSFTLTVPAGIFKAGNTAVCGAGRGGAGTATTEARALSEAKRFWDWPDLTPVKAIATGNQWK
ncbi:MAG: hypothetical protein NBV68_18345, partial [Erythrobacter sp.]|uniref:hypothetical protein n=1 Tax=Erythrobacter sp. TaxID=1042 RepID=UPI0025E8243A